ncbi:MAG: corrinoid protein [Eubacteriales bacterium]|nr:corrinoid protein [Eubacteriales bacterium]
MSALQEVARLVEAGRLKKIENAVRGALDAGASPEDILNAMTGAMDVVGERFQRGELFVPEILVSARAMQKGVAVLRPLLTGNAAGKYGKFIIGTVAGDMHDIGKNLVALMVESAGFEVIDLGVDVSAEQFVAAIRENPDCHVVGLSALLTTTMESMRATVAAIGEAGLRDQVRVMVGGAPITAEFASDIGADGYSPDAAAAAVLAQQLAS